jgi:hypothetical protein
MELGTAEVEVCGETCDTGTTQEEEGGNGTRETI